MRPNLCILNLVRTHARLIHINQYHFVCTKLHDINIDEHSFYSADEVEGVNLAAVGIQKHHNIRESEYRGSSKGFGCLVKGFNILTSLQKFSLIV